MAKQQYKIRQEWYGSIVSVFNGASVRAIVLSDKTSADDIKLLATINHPSLTTDNDTE